MAGGYREEMTCRELVELVTEYLEGTLLGLDRKRLEARLRECPYCEEYIAQMRRTVAVLGKLPPEPVDPDRKQELLEAFRAWRSASP
jgi:anti-sigma factor RsiW